MSGCSEAHALLLLLLFSCQVESDSGTPWTTAHQASLTLTISRSLPKFMSVESVMPSNHFILCLPLPLLLSIFASIKVFANESAVHAHPPTPITSLIPSRGPGILCHIVQRWKAKFREVTSPGLHLVFERGSNALGPGVPFFCSGLLYTACYFLG